ncbi:hypothetical protein [Acidovorax sacchari]|uniref:hypothetical protein n=1 Tax=Acidovorax sacchari TaxID=3230736 RepID=UPI0039E3E278
MLVLFLCLAGEVFYFSVEDDLDGLRVKTFLRLFFDFAAPLIVGYFSFGVTPSFWFSVFLCVVFVFFSGKYLRPIISERREQILLDIPYFDMKRRPVLSLGSLVIAYVAIALFFIKAVVD